MDPDFHLMRRLHESELDATLRNILSGEAYEFVVPERTADWESLAAAFQEALGGTGGPQLRLPGEPRSQATSIFLGTLPPDQGAIVQGGRFRIGEASFDAATHALVWAYKQEEGRYALVITSGTREGIVPLVRKIPHYGKYGYLVFRGVGRMCSRAITRPGNHCWSGGRDNRGRPGLSNLSGQDARRGWDGRLTELLVNPLFRSSPELYC